MPKIVAYLFALIFFLFFRSPVFAVNNIFINEFLANSIPGEGEWVEFYFPDGSFDISSYYLEDNKGTKKQLDKIENCSNSNYAIFNLISSNGNPLDGWLHNTEEESLYLKDSSGNTVDSYENWKAPKEGKTLGRIPDGSSNWHETEKATRCQQNSQALPTPTSTSQSSTSQSTPSTSGKSKSPSPSPKSSPSTGTSKTSSQKTSSVLGSSSSEATKSPTLEVNLSASPTPSVEPKAEESSNKMKIAGTVAGSGAIIMGISVGLYLWYRKRLATGDKNKEQT